MIYVLAVIAGGMVVLSMVMNSRVSRSIGVFQSVFVNYAVGLITAVLVFSACLGLGIEMPGHSAISAPWYAYLGAVFGIGIVASCNVVIPKISVVYSAVLIFLGQIVTGLLLDTLFSGYFDQSKALGAVLITTGLFINARIDASSQATA